MPAPRARLLPPGIRMAAADRSELNRGVAELKAEIAATPDSDLRPDVEVLVKAVDWALRDNEFYAEAEVAEARRLLAEARTRLAALRRGEAPWGQTAGATIRGYRSRLDGSVQPYVMIVPPEAVGPDGRIEAKSLEIWLQGRNEKRTELAFMAEATGRPPALALPGNVIVRPYGRFCNAYKFAGEVDVFECLNSVLHRYVVDPDHVALVGFSMGGAAVWHLAAHYPSALWCVASAGAGFAETAEFTGALRPGMPPRAWWEPILWRLYDATDYAANFFNLPIVAYSGALDEQKQSADVMEAAMAREGLRLDRLIGPKTRHAYEPETKRTLIRRLLQLQAQGYDDNPSEVRFVTYTPRYENQRGKVRILSLERMWRRAEVRARFGSGAIEVKTDNVAALSFEPNETRPLRIDGDPFEAGPRENVFWRRGSHWEPGRPEHRLFKEHGLSGPIDDAFMEPFLFVRPTGRPAQAAAGRWAEEEMGRAVKLWHDLFRGDVPVKDDREVTEEDLAVKNIILWGDPSSNALLRRLAPRLPIQWGGEAIAAGAKRYASADHALILIYPNPLNPARYVVLNSGIDFRDEAYGTNALQVPKLPDWAIVDLNEPPGPRWPGRIAEAGFFDREWRLSRERP